MWTLTDSPKAGGPPRQTLHLDMVLLLLEVQYVPGTKPVEMQEPYGHDAVHAELGSTDMRLPAFHLIKERLEHLLRFLTAPRNRHLTRANGGSHRCHPERLVLLVLAGGGRGDGGA